MMNWNTLCRYKLLGYPAIGTDERLFVFDLCETEMYYLNSKPGDGRNSRKPLYPEEWQNSFGMPVEQHKRALHVDYLDGYATLDLYNRPREEDFTAKEVSEDGAHSNHASL